MTDFSLSITGTVLVCCVHDRVKREITDLAFNPATHKAHLCGCCENLFLRTDDVPHYCPTCGGHPVHPVNGKLPDPLGEA